MKELLRSEWSISAPEDEEVIDVSPMVLGMRELSPSNFAFQWSTLEEPEGLLD